jgi:hypothetical protein
MGALRGKMVRSAFALVSLGIATVSLGCGGEVVENPILGAPGDGSSPDGGSPPTTDGHTAGGDSQPTGAMGGGPVDAGYYFGDGSFWVDGGAYPDLPDGSSPPGTDAGVGDASSGCGALSSCCVTLTGSSKSLCDSIAASGNATNCSAELTMLQSAGNCTGVTILASQIQEEPRLLVSDGRLLFWSSSAGLSAMPVRGGPITTVLSPPTGSDPGITYLTVDDVNLYVVEGYSFIRVPKNGTPATLVNERGAILQSATSLGSTAYWVENARGMNGKQSNYAVKSAPLADNTVATIARFSTFGGEGPLAVTSSTVFVGGMTSFPMSGVPAGGPMQLDPKAGGYGCNSMTSDTNAVYCADGIGPNNLRIANDGTSTSLGSSGGSSSSYIVVDDTYAYWADQTTVGTIVKAPKVGGGTATVIARDANPSAIAVDVESVYWGDMAGYIKSIAK